MKNEKKEKNAMLTSPHLSLKIRLKICLNICDSSDPDSIASLPVPLARRIFSTARCFRFWNWENLASLMNSKEAVRCQLL